MIGLQEGLYSFSALDCLFCSKLSKCHFVIFPIVFHPSLSLSSFSSTDCRYECYHSANIFLFCRCSFLRYSVFFGHLPANTGNMRFFAAFVHSLLFVMLFPPATFLFRFLLFSSAISSNRSSRHPHSLRLFRTVGHKGLLLSDICIHSPWGLQTVVLRLSCGLFVSAMQGRGVGARTVLPNVNGMLIALTTVFYLAMSPSPFQSDGRCCRATFRSSVLCRHALSQQDER